MPPRSSTNPVIFTQFSFAHHMNPKEWKRISVFYYFQGQFHIFKGNLTKFQDNSRTNGTILKFQKFSMTKIKFKDFSRSVRTLNEAARVLTRLYDVFSDAQGQLTPKSAAEFCQKSNSSKLL